MYDPKRVASVLELVASGQSFASISRSSGIARSTVRAWARGEVPRREPRYQPRGWCLVCSDSLSLLPVGPYSYLLGLYLGDGCLSEYRGEVFKLRIACCDAYPDLMDECAMTIAELLPNRIGRVHLVGCTEVYSYSKHWICFFPQHGPGPKHKRLIELLDWQQDIVDRFPAPFLRGLLHSDGCRVLNWVNGKAYPRYHFSNASADIRALFGRACDRLGVQWRPNNVRELSVARRDSVSLLDEFVGPKK